VQARTLSRSTGPGGLATAAQRLELRRHGRPVHLVVVVVVVVGRLPPPVSGRPLAVQGRVAADRPRAAAPRRLAAPAAVGVDGQLSANPLAPVDLQTIRAMLLFPRRLCGVYRGLSAAPI